MAKELLIHLGKTVRRHRRRVGLTQEQLGSPHVSKSFISQLERGKVSPSLPTLGHIAAQLRVPPAQLLMEADPVAKASARLDMAEAALFMEGVEAGGQWARKVAHTVAKDELSHEALRRRWQRYKGVSLLRQNKADEAIPLLRSARGDVDPITEYWLGLAYRQRDELLPALRTWESILYRANDEGVSSSGPSLLHVRTRMRLIELYEALGDERESKRTRHKLNALLFPLSSEDAVSVTSENAFLSHAHHLARLLWVEAERMWNRHNTTDASALARMTSLLTS